MDSKDIKALYDAAPSALAMLCLHKSPNDENSVAKGIPANPEYLYAAKLISKIIPITIKYRGPRRKGTLGQATCLKKDATSFAIYHR